MPVFKPGTNPPVFQPRFTVMEVKQLLKACEGQGPGSGGHAVAMHGQGRTDVTDRGKVNDSAFARSKMKHVKTGKIVPYSDQAFLVCNALNSPKGIQKLRELFLGSSSSGQIPSKTLVVEPQSVPAFALRVGHGSAKSKGVAKRMNLALFKINGQLHIHTAYADQITPL